MNTPTAKDGGKVDRIIESIVIDWLQYGEVFDENRAQNALTLIHALKCQLATSQTRCGKLEAALRHISEPAQSKPCCMEHFQKHGCLDNHDVEIADEALDGEK